MSIVVTARDLARYYTVSRGAFSGHATLKALDGVSFTIERGKTLAVVGESGCGKSTLARLVTMIELPTSGSLNIDGQEIVGASAAHVEGAALARADRVPEPLWLAQPAPEDRRTRWRSRCSSTPPCPPRAHARRRRDDDGQRGPAARALRPLSAHVLRRPAPAHRHCPRADAGSRSPRAGRAGLGARRFDPGAGAEPARRPAGAVRTSPICSSATTFPWCATSPTT